MTARTLSYYQGKAYEERDVCLSCPLRDCIGRDKFACPLRAAELETGALSKYTLRRIREAAKQEVHSG